MKALIIEQVGKLSIQDVPVPQIGAGEVLIKVKACGVCGTDFHIAHHGHGAVKVAYPLIPGHEFAGEVVEVAGDVSEFQAGDQVVADPTFFCGQCFYCRNNQQNHCLNIKALGTNVNGAFAEYVAVNKQYVYGIGEQLSFQEGAFVEPLACVVQGLHLLQPQAASNVLIFGAGPIGNLLIQAMRHAGAAQIVVVDRVDQRLQMARAKGANVGIDLESTRDLPKEIEQYQPLGFDVVIDATGVPEVVESMIGYTRNGGTMVLFGVCPDDRFITISPYEIFKKEITIIGSFAQPLKFNKAIDLLQNQVIDVNPLVSHALSLEEVKEVLEGKTLPASMKLQVQF